MCVVWHVNLPRVRCALLGLLLIFQGTSGAAALGTGAPRPHFIEQTFLFSACAMAPAASSPGPEGVGGGGGCRIFVT